MTRFKVAVAVNNFFSVVHSTTKTESFANVEHCTTEKNHLKPIANIGIRIRFITLNAGSYTLLYSLVAILVCRSLCNDTSLLAGNGNKLLRKVTLGLAICALTPFEVL